MQPPLVEDPHAGVSRKAIEYVPKDDVVLPELAVREIVLHSARTRLPSDWSDKDTHRYVRLFLICLQLQHVEDSRVGRIAAFVISGVSASVSVLA